MKNVTVAHQSKWWTTNLVRWEILGPKVSSSWIYNWSRLTWQLEESPVQVSDLWSAGNYGRNYGKKGNSWNFPSLPWYWIWSISLILGELQGLMKARINRGGIIPIPFTFNLPVWPVQRLNGFWRMTRLLCASLGADSNGSGYPRFSPRYAEQLCIALGM